MDIFLIIKGIIRMLEAAYGFVRPYVSFDVTSIVLLVVVSLAVIILFLLFQKKNGDSQRAISKVRAWRFMPIAVKLLIVLYAVAFLGALYFHEWLLAVSMVAFACFPAYICWFETIESPDVGALYFWGDLKGSVGPGFFVCFDFICYVRKSSREFLIFEVEDEELYVKSKSSLTDIAVGIQVTIERGSSYEDLEKDQQLRFPNTPEGMQALTRVFRNTSLSEVKTDLGKDTVRNIIIDQGGKEQLILEKIEKKISSLYGWHCRAVELYNTKGSKQVQAEGKKLLGGGDAHALKQLAESVKGSSLGEAAAMMSPYIGTALGQAAGKKLFSTGKKPQKKEEHNND
ncbi:MAG: hypothetical protein Q8O83_04525 [bacterium]|nr:hypothetical protein [bacterium]